MRRQRDHPDGEGEQRADERRYRDAPGRERDAIRAPPLRLAVAELDHRELRRGEREQDAEAEQAREEEDRMREPLRRDQPRDRDHGRGDDRLRRYERARVEPAELSRELSVLAERVREPAEARNRRRRRGEQDQRAGQADE